MRTHAHCGSSSYIPRPPPIHTVPTAMVSPVISWGSLSSFQEWVQPGGSSNTEQSRHSEAPSAHACFLVRNSQAFQDFKKLHFQTSPGMFACVLFVHFLESCGR